MSALDKLLDAPGTAFECDDDTDAVNAMCLERGWTDGLPVFPPSPQRVERMLEYCDRPWDQPVAALAPRYGAATPVRIAANAAMAGCRPEYFPLVMLALEALADEAFNLYGVQATTHPCTPLLIFNGPIAVELGINAGHNAFGPGVQANATIGRAVRLALLNIGGAIPGLGDMATVGTPAKYSFCIAENEAASPWAPLHVERGFPAHASTVTVVAAESPHNINDHESISGKSILTSVAGTMAVTGPNNTMHASQPVVALSPEHAATIAVDGYSKQQVKAFLYQHARVPLGRFSTENIERRLRVKFPERFATAGPEVGVPLAQSAEDIVVIVLGGAGKHSMFIPTFGSTRTVTRALMRTDGELARSVQELRAGPQ